MEKGKSKVDRIREAGGMANIGTEEDGAVIAMFNIGDKLIIVKERAIYEFMLADSVDPERSNPDLPTNIQRKIISKGAESEMVSRTFLTAKMLFKSEFFDDSINVTRATELSLEVVRELGALEKEINDYLQLEEKLNRDFEDRMGKNISYEVPSIEDVETRCKTIFQKADHLEQILMEIITLFYPGEQLTRQSHFPKFHEILTKKYGSDDPFCKYVESKLKFMKIIRGLRNGLDHRLDTTKVVNYELQKDSNVLTPTIEFKHKGDVLERVGLSTFLPIVLRKIIDIFENTIAYLCEKNVKLHPFKYHVKEIPEEKRRFPMVKFCFWSPIGDGGFYNQQF